MSLPTTKIMVISVPTARERREAFEKSITGMPPRWDYFDAFSNLSPSLIYTADAALRKSANVLNKAELGCYSSHYSLWRWLLDSDYSQIIIFEDDVVVDWPFIEKLQRIDFASQGIHYLRLFTKIPARWRYVKTPFFDKYHHLIRFTNFALGSQAYILTREGARILIEHGQRLDCAVDVFMDRYWQHGLPNLALYPFHVFERFQESSIGYERFETPKLSASQRLSYLRVKLWDKFNILINRLPI